VRNFLACYRLRADKSILSSQLLFRKRLEPQGKLPWQLVTDKLSAYKVAHRRVFQSVWYRTGQYENNQAEASHQPNLLQKRAMRGSKSAAQTLLFLSAHDTVQYLFRITSVPVLVEQYQLFMDVSFLRRVFGVLKCPRNGDFLEKRDA
jgi:transposase-like protein